MNRLVRDLVIVTLMAMLIAAFWTYRTEKTAAIAAQYAPAAPHRTLIPAGTQFQAILRDGIAESTRAGDRIVGFVSVPVVVNNELAIPAGTELKGVVEDISAGKKMATVRLNFDHLVFHDRELSIQTKSVIARAPIVSDFDILSSALQTATGAAVGAAMGAASGNESRIGRGIVEGALSGVAPSEKRITQITLVLNEALELPA
ncbi:MAG TPA: hypothetical protein VE422_06580 [Terriglobia bacterium]|nr:hypothetical protein [Terriglobia bacterium]